MKKVVWTKKMRQQQARRMRKLIKTGKIDVHKSYKKGPKTPFSALLAPGLREATLQAVGHALENKERLHPSHEFKAAVRDAYTSGINDGVRLGWDQANVHRP